MTKRPSRSGLAGLLALLAAFVAGGGTALLIVWGEPGPSTGAVASREQPAQAEGELLEGLELTPEQRRAVDSILERLRAISDSTFGAATERLRAETERARSAIEAELTEEQARRFGERLRELRTLRVRRIQVGDSVVRQDTLPALEPPR